MFTHTEIGKQTIGNIEIRLSQLVLLAVVVILYLTLMFLALQFLGFIDKSNIIAMPENAYQYSIFLSILVLVFCTYIFTQQRKLIQLSREYFEEKASAHMLRQNVRTLSSLLEVSCSINSRETLPDTLNIIARQMLVCFQSDQSSIMLLDRQSKLLKTNAAFGKGQMNEKIIGVLNVNLVERDRTFSEADLKLITIFANNAAVAIHNAMLLKEKSERIRLQTMFEQMHSPQIVQELIKKTDDTDEPNKMRERLEMTILFADIRGFSNLMAVLELEAIMDFLDEFYSAMTKIVFNNEGSIDKFIGDEVMAFFGAPLSLKNSNENGVKTALEMVKSFQALKENFSENSTYFNQLGIGVGVNSGEVFVGSVGSKTRYDYTVIGTAVNVARRLCSYAEQDQILTTEKTLNKIPGFISSEFVKDINFKGTPEPVRIYRVIPH